MKEQWAMCRSMEGYAVSTLGRVRHMKTGRELRPMAKPNGYLYVAMHQTKRANRYVHRLVAEAFLAAEPGRGYVNHKDGNRQNNRLENLEWCTNAENVQHAYDNGLHPITNRHREASRENLRRMTPRQREKALLHRREWWDGLPKQEQLERMQRAGRASAARRKERMA